MHFGKKLLLILIPSIFLLGLFIFIKVTLIKDTEIKIFGITISNKSTPKLPKEIQQNGRTKVKYSEDFTIVLLGDSMTERLGNSDELRAYLKNYYPKKTFEVLNYGFGSTNILSVQERLEKETMYGRKFRPILDIAFDLILIESFGNNPLSDFPLEEGLKKQNEALDKIVNFIRTVNPNAKIVFVATVAPNKRRYGEGVVRLDLEQKRIWVEERVAYIKNHIEYAKTHDISLVNIFEKSLNSEGDGKLDFLDEHDYIHPSPNGIYFISQEIANFIFENKILSP
ncbi:MAG: GDSL-type esterase/lipase family protein [Candidatus Daviesbacteria bacterium]